MGTCPSALTLTTLLGGALVVVTARPAAAQPTPTFKFGDKAEVAEVKDVTWTATAEAGLVVTTGNAETLTGTGAAKVTRLDEKNKLEGAVAVTYARSTVLIALDGDGSGTIGPDEIAEATSTTANSWQTRLRYDRFLTELNALYATAQVGADQPAGRDLVAGGQIGYSRSLYKTEKHQTVAEVGYDFSYEDLTAGDPLAIHSARVFTGYKGTPNSTVNVESSVEALANLNTLNTIPEESGPLEDLRINGVAAVTAQLTKDIAFSMSITVKYDRVPAPRAPFPGIPYDAGFVPLANSLDTITKASLIVTLF